MRKLILSAFILSASFDLHAQAFTLATSGCPDVHCSLMGDNLTLGGLLPPLTDISVLNVMSGSGAGSNAVGCTSSGTATACTQASGAPHISVYDGSGTLLYTSGTSGTFVGAGMCPAMLGADNGFITADTQNVYRFGPTTGGGAGPLLWSTQLPWHASGLDCGEVVLTANGLVTVLPVNGPLATFNASTGALQGSQLQPGLSSGNYYVSQKEGVCVVGNSIYQARQWNASPYAEAVMRFDVSSSGPVVGNILASTITMPATATQGASTNCEITGGNTQVYFDSGSNSSGYIGGVTAAMQCYVDNGGASGFSVCNSGTGWPVTTAALTASSSAQAIVSGGSSTSSFVTFGVTGQTGFTVGQTANVFGNGTSAYDGTWQVHALATNSVTLVNSANLGAPPAGGTIQPSNAGPFTSGFSVDSRGCLWLYVARNPALYCQDQITGATDYTVATTAGFIPGQPQVVGGSVKTMFINPANSHNILMMDLNVTGVSNYVVAIDVNAGALLWCNLVGSNSGGQFSALTYNGFSRVAFGLGSSGPRVLGLGGVAIQ